MPRESCTKKPKEVCEQKATKVRDNSDDDDDDDDVPQVCDKVERQQCRDQPREVCEQVAEVSCQTIQRQQCQPSCSPTFYCQVCEQPPEDDGSYGAPLAPVQETYGSPSGAPLG